MSKKNDRIIQFLHQEKVFSNDYWAVQVNKICRIYSRKNLFKRSNCILLRQKILLRKL